MANGPDPDLSPSEPAPEVVPPVSLGNDQEALRKIGRRTTPFGRVMMVLLVAGAGVLAFFGWRGKVAYDTRMEGVDACGQLAEREALLTCLREELSKTEFADVKDRIMRNLGHFRDAGAVPTLIAQIEEPGLVRRSAALALASIGTPDADPAREPLFKVLPKTTEKDSTAVVWALAVLGETRASDQVLRAFSEGRLQEMEGFSPRVITAVLGPALLSSDALINHEEESIRMLTAKALAEAPSAEVVAPLTRLIRSELDRSADERSTSVLSEAAAGLGRTGDPRAAGPLFELMGKQPAIRNGVIDALTKAAGAPALAMLIDRANNDAVRRDLIRILAGTHDSRAADAMATHLNDEDDEIRSTVATALADLGDERAIPALLELAAGQDEPLAAAALDGLQRLGSPNAANGLLALLPERGCPPEPGPDTPQVCYRRATLLGALGATRNPAVGPTVERALESVDAPAAAEALATIDYEPAYSKLLGLVSRPADVNMAASSAADRSLTNEDLLRKRRGAIRAIGLFGRPGSAAALSTVVEDTADDYELRSLAAASLGMVATDEVMQGIVSRLSSLDESAQRYYVQAFWQKPHRALNAKLLDLAASRASGEIRRAAALAVGYSGDPASDERLIGMLADEGTRKEAALAIVLGGNPRSVRALMDVLVEDNDTEEVLQYAVTHEGHDWFSLLTAQMFESGQIWRRLEAGRLLAKGTRGRRWGFPWMKTLQVLKTGWAGANGVNARESRARIYAALTGEDAHRRALAARALADMGERGLLIRARDENGVGTEEARSELDRLNRS